MTGMLFLGEEEYKPVREIVQVKERYLMSGAVWLITQRKMLAEELE